MKTHTAVIDGQSVLATTVGDEPLYRRSTGDGYTTNERAICNCGRVCECAGDLRCNACQAAAAAALTERVRLGVAAGVAKRRAQRRLAGAA